MRNALFVLVFLMSACGFTKSSARLHSITMDVAGPRLYDYRIDYGELVLPFPPNGDTDFGGGTTVMEKMPLPEVAIVRWRTEPAPAGRVVRFEVPIRDRVTDDEWRGKAFTLEFISSPTSLNVAVENGMEDFESGRLIFSGSVE